MFINIDLDDVNGVQIGVDGQCHSLKYGCLLWCFFFQKIQVFQQVLARAIFLIAFAFIITILGTCLQIKLLSVFMEALFKFSM